MYHRYILTDDATIHNFILQICNIVVFSFPAPAGQKQSQQWLL